MPLPHATDALREGEKYSLLDTSFEVLEVPGHTLCQICFWFAEMNALFVGDTLFSCGCGRLFEGTYDQLFSSLRKIASLPPETEIYFGHEYTLNNIAFLEANGQSSADLQEYKKNSLAKLARQNHTTPVTLANELALNPFLKAQSIDELKKWREARNSW